MGNLSAIKIRLILPCEHEAWFSLLEQFHYLGRPSKVVGERLLYVAEDARGNWIALIGWSAAAMHIAPRDEWIGWSVSIRKLRLKYVANNFRFFILPNVLSRRNMASKVLSLNLKILAQDWTKTYGRPVYLAETFVDKSKFYGGCYRASNWQQVGLTKGFSKTREPGMLYKENGGKNLFSFTP